MTKTKNQLRLLVLVVVMLTAIGKSAAIDAAQQRRLGERVSERHRLRRRGEAAAYARSTVKPKADLKARSGGAAGAWAMKFVFEVKSPGGPCPPASGEGEGEGEGEGGEGSKAKSSGAKAKPSMLFVETEARIGEGASSGKAKSAGGKGEGEGESSGPKRKCTPGEAGLGYSECMIAGLVMFGGKSFDPEKDYIYHDDVGVLMTPGESCAEAGKPGPPNPPTWEIVGEGEGESSGEGKASSGAKSSFREKLLYGEAVLDVDISTVAPFTGRKKAKAPGPATAKPSPREGHSMTLVDNLAYIKVDGLKDIDGEAGGSGGEGGEGSSKGSSEESGEGEGEGEAAKRPPPITAKCNSFVVFGGYNGGGDDKSFFNDVFMLHVLPPAKLTEDIAKPADATVLQGFAQGKPAAKLEVRWEKPPISGTQPLPRMQHAAVNVGPWVIVHGGMSAKGFLDDTWVLDAGKLATSGADVWVRPEIAGEGPSRRAQHSATIVTVGGKDVHVFVFGGVSEFGLTADAYMLKTGCTESKPGRITCPADVKKAKMQWTQVTQSGVLPGARQGHWSWRYNPNLRVWPKDSIKPRAKQSPNTAYVFGGFGYRSPNDAQFLERWGKQYPSTPVKMPKFQGGVDIHRVTCGSAEACAWSVAKPGVGGADPRRSFAATMELDGTVHIFGGVQSKFSESFIPDLKKRDPLDSELPDMKKPIVKRPKATAKSLMTHTAGKLAKY